MVFSECYALPVFLEESSKLIEENMVKGATSMWREKIFHEDFSPELDLDVPFKGMKQLTDILYSMEKDTKQVLDRFKKLSGPDKEKIISNRYPYMYWRDPQELTDLKLNRIDSCIKTVQDICGTVSQDPSKASTVLKDATDDFKDGMKLRNLKLSVVKTSIPYYMSTRDMLDFKRDYKVSVNLDWIDCALIPFLLEFYNIKLRSNIKEGYKDSSFKYLTKNIEATFNGALNRVNMLKESLLATTDKGIHGQVEVFFYTVDMLILQLAQYVVSVYMRTLSAYISNMRSIMNMISVLDIKSGDVEDAITESVVDLMDTCTLKDPTDIIRATDSVMTGLTNMNVVTDELLHETSGIKNVDDYTYKFPIIALGDLDNRLRALVISCKNDKDSPIDDLLEDAKLTDGDISELFEKVTRAENVNFLKTVEFRPAFIYRDLECMKNYIPRISEGLNTMTDIVIRAYINALNENVNNVFPNPERNTDTIEFLQKLSGKVSEYGRELGKAYTRRLKAIGDKFKVDDEIQIDLEPDMYFGDAIASSYKVITEYSEAVEEVNNKYMQMYISASIGADFFEDDNNGNQNNNNQNGNGNNNQNSNQQGNNNSGNQNNGGSNGNSGDNKKDAGKNPQKPTVEDNSNTNNNGNQNNNNQNQNGNGNDNKKSIVNRLKDFIDKTIENITEYFEKNGAKKKNKGFLSLHERFLKSRNYTNTRVNILPYLKDDDYMKKAQNLLDTIAGIDDNTLKTADEKTLMNRVFSKFKVPEGEEALDVKLTQVFKIGSAKPVTVTLENNSLKAEIPGMFDFVNDYYDNFVTKLEGMKKNVEKLGELDNKKGNGDNDRTEANKALLSNWSNSIINAARSASRDRVNDIMLIFSALAKNDPAGKEDNGGNGGNNTSNNQNQNGNENGSNNNSDNK